MLLERGSSLPDRIDRSGRESPLPPLSSSVMRAILGSEKVAGQTGGTLVPPHGPCLADLDPLRP